MKKCGPKRLTSGKKDNVKNGKKMATINPQNDGNKNLEKEDGSMTTPAKEWWKEFQSTKPGPSRIRITISRELTPAEQEHLRQVGTEIRETGDKLRLSSDSRIYAESHNATSRQLYEAINVILTYSFVNVFPTAVRTFRELVPGPVKLVKPVAISKEDVQDYLPPKVGDVTYTGTIPVFADLNEVTVVANKKRTKGKKVK